MSNGSVTPSGRPTYEESVVVITQELTHAQRDALRDPKTSPLAGDMLRKGRDVRLVQSVRNDAVVYGNPDGVAVRAVSPAAWTVWAIDADIVEVENGEFA